MEKDDVGQYCESRILLLRQNDCRVQQGYLEIEVGMCVTTMGMKERVNNVYPFFVLSLVSFHESSFSLARAGS